jgi:hypothetical protein
MRQRPQDDLAVAPAVTLPTTKSSWPL